MRLHGVGRRYGLGGPWVLRGVDLELPSSGLVRVEGVNGGGKSTLLRLLAGIDAPSAGRITGRPRAAYVPERFPAALPLTALGYLTHLGRIHGLERTAARRAAGDWLERFDALGHADTPLAALSKGTSQKVAVAQALLAEPGLLVLDEAWTGLDQSARGVLDRAVQARVAAGGLVVFVDHDPLRLAGAADVAYRVADGGLLPASAPAADATPAPDRSGTGGTAAGLDTGPPRDAPRAGRGAPGPRVAIDVEGPPGATLPDRLPGAPEVSAAAPPGTAGGAGRPVRLTVGAAHSDALLRALLSGRPPWHIRAVTPVPPGAVRPTGAADDHPLPSQRTP
ncbi:ATP-binding cassette domain-containing protein [Streptomyces sp. SAJ15]|uniref:ABC transporter ATP-binding protein n=1 Tax=Streptomyces sp. SAJ15 TaxID=2011095 RepID=UPI0016426C39|nr:ATP-binding cassette domain-containing protein [Streptomyces sp. SAJ15]